MGCHKTMTRLSGNGHGKNKKIPEEEVDAIFILEGADKVGGIEVPVVPLLSPQLVLDDEAVGGREVGHGGRVQAASGWR